MKTKGLAGRVGTTPLIQQYLDIKSHHTDAFLFFRVGDFYELFFDDAKEGSRLLGLTLTERNNGGTERVPLAGVPAKAIDEYVLRLVDAGKRVAICDQVEDAAVAQGIVKREVTEVVTPGTILSDRMLEDGRNNFVAAVSGEGPFGLAIADTSTGDFELHAAPDTQGLADELGRIEAAELVCSEDFPPPGGSWHLTRLPAWRFDPELGEETFKETFSLRSIAGLGLERGPEVDSDHLMLAAGAALLGYLEDVRPGGSGHMRPPRVDRTGQVMHLDEMTRRNLELVEPLHPGQGKSLLHLLDRTRTPMGARLLRRRLLRPLVQRSEISRRLDSVDELVSTPTTREQVRQVLGSIRDLERPTARLQVGRISPRELLGLGQSLASLPNLKAALVCLKSEILAGLRDGLDGLEDVAQKIADAIDPEASAALNDSGVIRSGFSPELDAVRDTRDEAVDAIAGLQVRERAKTGIDTLKIGFNKVFGYFLEVTRSKLHLVPEEWTRRQTLTGTERYVTPELKELESQVLRADEEILHLERELFQSLRTDLGLAVGRIQKSATDVAEIDFIACLAHVAEAEDYTRPELTDDIVLEVEGGRHPVVESTVARDTFIPNDIALNDECRTIIVTGPNMAGKSTVLRQVGLIAVLAHVGSFVPADAARVGCCDRIFTRVGASDNLAGGLSTFMVEMTETATILNGASERSLVLLDEIGRGTSTYDGISIAWAVTERLHELRARTVFATHYHELVGLADSLERAQPWNVSVREAGGDIVFLYRLEPGGADRSYGVHVARLAGLPPDVVGRAASILQVLETGPWGASSRGSALADGVSAQLPLFAGPGPFKGRSDTPDPKTELARELLKRIEGLDVNRLTPLEALTILAEWKEAGTRRGREAAQKGEQGAGREQGAGIQEALW